VFLVCLALFVSVFEGVLDGVAEVLLAVGDGCAA
jgi:hypothetical protein